MSRQIHEIRKMLGQIVPRAETLKSSFPEHYRLVSHLNAVYNNGKNASLNRFDERISRRDFRYLEEVCGYLGIKI